jgi:hypothetical protein
MRNHSHSDRNGDRWTRDASPQDPRTENRRSATTDATRLLAALRRMKEKAPGDGRIPLPPLTVRPRPPL